MPKPTARFGVGVVLLNYRGAADTLACLDSLLRSSRLPERVVIADNASPDGSLATLRAGLAAREAALREAAMRCAGAAAPLQAWAERGPLDAGAMPPPPVAWLTLLDNGENRGFAAGNNPGLRLLRAEPSLSHFWLLNNDTELPPHSLAALHAVLAQRPEIDLWGGTVQYHAPPHAVQALGGGALNRRTGETRHLDAFRPADRLPPSAAEVAAVEAEMDYALGACMVASRRWLERVGLLNERYFLYYEEIDWASRGRALGLRLGYAPELVVLHKEGASIGTDPSGGSPLSVFHLNRSRWMFVRRYLPELGLGRLIASLLRLSLRLIRHRRWPQIGALWRGSLEGWRQGGAVSP